MKERLAVPPDIRFEQRPFLDLVVAVQDLVQPLLPVRHRNVGDEAQPPAVDADDGHLQRGQRAGYPQHGAVAPHHHG